MGQLRNAKILLNILYYSNKMTTLESKAKDIRTNGYERQPMDEWTGRPVELEVSLDMEYIYCI